MPETAIRFILFQMKFSQRMKFLSLSLSLKGISLSLSLSLSLIATVLRVCHCWTDTARIDISFVVYP